MRSLILSIYVRSFDLFFWISKKYMASRSSAKSLSFYFHTGLRHNFNILLSYQFVLLLRKHDLRLGLIPICLSTTTGLKAVVIGYNSPSPGGVFGPARRPLCTILDFS